MIFYLLELGDYLFGVAVGFITLILVTSAYRLARTYLHKQNNAPWNQSTPTQGVWPPPPSPSGWS